ncbi:MAG: GxxExxY protein [Patescibacteria group bacterium]
MTEVCRKDLIHPELSYEIVGAAFSVYNQLGFGHKEVYYQRALAEEFKKINIKFEREKQILLEYDGKQIGKYILDFVVDGKIIVELKVRPRLGYTDIKQVKSYLKSSNFRLAILIYFLKDKVSYRRILNAETKRN